MTTIRRPLAVACTALLAGLALAIPTLAEAKKPPRYKMELKGSQVTTWNQGHTPQFPCDATVAGDGSQQVTYKTFRPSRATLIRPKGAPALFASPSDSTAQYGYAIPMAAGVVVEREGYQNIQAPGPPCSGTGGWDGQAPPKDCGRRSGLLRFHLGWAKAPIGPAGAEDVAGRLKLSARYDTFGDLEQPLGHTFENCPFWAPFEAGAGSDQLLVASERVSSAKFARLRRGRSIKVVADASLDYDRGDFGGRTINTWTLKLTRIK